MPTVETVNGPVDVEDLGLTLIHEHFRATDEAGRMQFPHLYDEQGAWEAALCDANARSPQSSSTRSRTASRARASGPRSSSALPTYRA
jgi:phosphotriesterase-related protein